MTRRLLALIGLAVLPLTAPRPGASVPVGSSGESLRVAPTTESPARGSLTPADAKVDQFRSADVTGAVAAPPFGLGPDPSDHPFGNEDANRFPRRSTLRLLPLSRAPPA